MTELTIKKRGPISGNSAYDDKELEAGGISVNQDNYDSSLDRTYNVKGLNNMHVEIENTGGSNGLTFKIENARKAFQTISELVDSDFNNDIKPDTIVAFGTTDISDVIDISPETTAIKIRIKRQTAGLDTIVQGIVSVN